MATEEENLPTYNETVEDRSGPPAYPADIAAEEARHVIGGESAPPPSYDSIFGQVKEAREEHGMSWGFFEALGAIIAGAIGGILCVVLVSALLALPIAQLVLGVMYKEECPVNHMIPTFLIVTGSFGILSLLLQIIESMCCKSDENSRSPCTVPKNIINFFLTVWFICGNVWVYKIYKTVSYTEDFTDESMYCHKTLYLFAFWSITGGYILVGVVCFIACGCVCFACCCSGN